MTAAVLSAVAMAPGEVSAAAFFSTGFNAMPLHASLEDENASFVITAGDSLLGNVIRRDSNTTGTLLDRRYIRTSSSDYNTTDFVYEITLNNTGEGISFVGFGEGTRRPVDNWPDHAVYWIVQEGSIKFDYQNNLSESPEFVSGIVPDKQYRARITKKGDQLLFELDEGNDGSFEFSPSTDVNLSSPAFDFLIGRGRLFFGTAVTQREFDDMRVLGGLAGDMNDDGIVDPADVTPFMLALTSRSQYEAQFPGVLADVRGDIDSSGLLDVGDVGPFSQMLSVSSKAAAVPEPGGLPLALCALLGILLVHAIPSRHGWASQPWRPFR